MSFTQANICRPCVSIPKISRSKSTVHGNPNRKVSCVRFAPLLKHQPIKILPTHGNPKRTHNSQRFAPLLKLQRKQQKLSPVCLLGGKDKSGKDEGSPWNSLEKAMGNLKGKSIEEVLREQMVKQEFFDEGSGSKPPAGGGGSGGGGGGQGSGGTGENSEGSEGGVLDEFLQVIFATLGFVFLYVYIITGEEMYRLAKDYIRYLLKGTKSVRLRRVMDKWQKIIAEATEQPEEDPDWLAKEIINTPTWYDSPEKYKDFLKYALSPGADEEE